jgi:ABC-type branched-subunit amino acid transport system substrate-binding protein
LQHITSICSNERESEVSMVRTLIRAVGACTLAACTAMALVVTVGGAPAGASGSAPGVTAKHKTITLGVITPLSGPAALIGKPLTNGNKAYFDWVNAHGGIDGWKVHLIVKDDGYTPTKHVSDYNTIVTKVLFLAQSLGSPTTSAIESQAASQHVLLGTAAQDSSFVNHNINLVQGTPYAVTVANALYYVTHTLHKGGAKFGIVYNNTAYGKDGLKGYKAAQSAYHFKTVSEQTGTATETTFTSQATALKNSGAQYVVATVLPTEAAYLIGTAALLQYHPQWILQGPAWSEYLMTTNGTPSGKPTPAEGAMQGAWVLGYLAAWGTTKKSSGMKLMLQATHKYFPTQIPDGYYEYGFGQAWIEGALLKKVIKSHHITRTEVLTAKKHLGTVSTGGLLPKAKYTPKNGPADRQTEIGQVTKTDGAQGFVKVIKGFFTTKVAKNMTFTSAATG